jgi:hypothetical protein
VSDALNEFRNRKPTSAKKKPGKSVKPKNEAMSVYEMDLG